MTDPVETAGLVVGGGVGWKAVEFLFARFVSRADKERERADAERDTREKEMSEKIDRLLTDVGDLKSEIRLHSERATAVQASVSEMRGRLDGVSKNHADRLTKLEELTVRLDERINGRKVKR